MRLSLWPSPARQLSHQAVARQEEEKVEGEVII